MGDSGISDNSFKDSSDESFTEDKIRDNLPSECQVNHQKHTVLPRLVKSQATMSNHNISSQQDSSNLSRASSTLSLAASSYGSSSPVTVMDVRTLTNNFQAMLAKATQEIKKLNIQKTKLEKEQEKLLTVNIELATEAKRLVKEVKEGNAEKKGLLAANDEFVEEVKRLYREEELWQDETIKLKAESAKISDSFESELQKVKSDWEEEEKNFMLQKEKLLDSIRVLTFDNDRLLQEKENLKLGSSKSQLELKEVYENKMLKLETTIDCLRSEMENEHTIKGEVDKHVEELTDELKKVRREMDRLKADHEHNLNQIQEKYAVKFKLLERKSEKLASENFEYAVENEQLEKKWKVNSESKKLLDKELSQLKVENQWLVNNNKKAIGSEHKVGDMARELQELKLELRNEKEKVKNLTDWKVQLVEKNKSLKDENNRLLKKTEDLEHVMNAEVSDINEMLKTINNLQDGSQLTNIKNMKRFM